MTPATIAGLVIAGLQTTSALLVGPKQRKAREVVAGIASALSGVPATIDALADGWDEDDVDALGAGLVVLLDAVSGVRTHEAERIGYGVAAGVGVLVRLAEKDDGGELGEVVRRGRKNRANRLPDSDHVQPSPHADPRGIVTTVVDLSALDPERKPVLRQVDQ